MINLRALEHPQPIVHFHIRHCGRGCALEQLDRRQEPTPLQTVFVESSGSTFEVATRVTPRSKSKPSSSPRIIASPMSDTKNSSKHSTLASSASASATSSSGLGVPARSLRSWCTRCMNDESACATGHPRAGTRRTDPSTTSCRDRRRPTDTTRSVAAPVGVARSVAGCGPHYARPDSATLKHLGTVPRASPPPDAGQGPR